MSRRILVAGVAGGVAANVAMFVTFGVLGFRSGLLLDPRWQSPKLIAVWTQISPLPRVVSSPFPVVIGFVVFALFHAWLYIKLAPNWPPGVWPRAWRLGGLVFLLSYVFFEFFTPFNLLWEPLAPAAVELVFWAVIALIEAVVIVGLLPRQP